MTDNKHGDIDRSCDISPTKIQICIALSRNKRMKNKNKLQSSFIEKR